MADYKVLDKHLNDLKSKKYKKDPPLIGVKQISDWLLNELKSKYGLNCSVTIPKSKRLHFYVMKVDLVDNSMDMRDLAYKAGQIVGRYCLLKKYECQDFHLRVFVTAGVHAETNKCEIFYIDCKPNEVLPFDEKYTKRFERIALSITACSILSEAATWFLNELKSQKYGLYCYVIRPNSKCAEFYGIGTSVALYNVDIPKLTTTAKTVVGAYEELKKKCQDFHLLVVLVDKKYTCIKDEFYIVYKSKTEGC